MPTHGPWAEEEKERAVCEILSAGQVLLREKSGKETCGVNRKERVWGGGKSTAEEPGR